MTDKDPKDMTVSELLREADSSPCSMCHLVMDGDESCATTGCASWAYRLADKIDAELAQARELSLRRGDELWAKANGWPDFRDGEDFGAWLDRCAIRIPCFEDGEPLTPGASFIQKYTGECTCKGFSVAVFSNESVGNAVWHPGERVKRPAPEVLGADGLPIKVGDAMWSLSGAGPLTVTSLHTDDPTPDGGDSPWADLDDDGLYSWIYAGSLTHTPPDTLERLRDDMLRTAEEWREADSVSVTDMNHWANRLTALIERMGGE